MSEHRQDHIDLCAAYALDTLSDVERRQLEQHLAPGCDECEAALRDFSQATVAIAASVPTLTPPVSIRQAVLSRVEADAAGNDSAAAPSPSTRRPTRTRRGSEISVWGWAAAAACLAFALWNWSTAERLRSELQTQRVRVQQVESQLDDVQRRLANEARWASVVNALDAKVAQLAPTADGDANLRARAVVDPASNSAVVLCANMRAPANRAYELWILRGAQPTSLGVIPVDANGRAVVRLDDVGDVGSITAFAVSLEPPGGSPTPTAPSGPVVMVGALGG